MKTLCLWSTIVLYSLPIFALESELYKPQKSEDNDTLFVVFHGCFQTKKEAREGMMWNQMADNKGFHVLYFDQAQGKNKKNCWSWDDEKKLHKVHDEIGRVVRENSLNPQQVYLIGFSDGGEIAGRLAACYPTDYAGIAAHSSSAKSILKPDNGPFMLRGDKFCNFRDYFGKIFLVYGTRDWITPRREALKWVDAFFGYIPDSRSKKFRPPRKYSFKTVDYFEGEFFQLRTVLVDRLGHEWSGGKKNKEFFNSSSIDIRSHIWDYFYP